MNFLTPALHRVTLALLLAVSLSACDNPQQKEARYISRGNALFDKEEFEKARLEYKNAAKIVPSDAEPLYRLGLVEEATSDLHNAFSAFASAEQQNQHFHPAILKIAQYYMAAEQYDETRRRVTQVLGEDPNDAEAHALNAALLLRDNKMDEAEKEALFAMEKDPGNITACAALTGIYSAQSQYDKAEATVNTGIAKHPKNMALLTLRVVLYEHMDNLEKIAQGYQAIFKLRPDDLHYRDNLVQVYLNAGKIDEAEAVLRDGIATLPDNPDVGHALILFLGDHRSVEVAEKEITAMRKSDPHNGDLDLWLAELYATHDAIDKATAILEQIVANGGFDQPSLKARTLLARIDIRRGSADLALRLVSAVLDKAPENAAALLIRANLEIESGDYQNAVSDLHNITRIHPNDPAALQLLAETLLLQGHLELAIDTMHKLIDADPSNITAQIRLAQMVHLNGDLAQATAIITQVTQLAPDNALAWESAARFAIDDEKWLPARAAIAELDKIDGQHLTAVFLEGQIQERTYNTDAAIAKYHEVIDANPTAPLAEHALTSLIDLYSKQKHIDNAATYLEGLKTDSPFIAGLLGKCYVALGKNADAAVQFDKVIAANAAIQQSYVDRAKLYLADADKDAAISVLKKGMNSVPDNYRAPMMLAALLGDSGHYREAADLYESMLARNNGLDAAANNLAELIADYEPNNNAALEKARLAAERFAGSHDPLLLDTLAWVYYRQGDTPLALTTMERAMKEASDRPLPGQMHYHYGVILIKMGNKNMAKTQLDMAITPDTPYPGLDEAKKLRAGL